MGYLIVRNPQFRLLPGFIRRALGEEYMGVEVKPFFTDNMREARVFPSYEWARTYTHSTVFDRPFPHAVGCVIRSTLRAHNIPGLSEGAPPVSNEKGKS